MGIRERILARRDLDEARKNKDITALAAELNLEGLMVGAERFVTGRTILAECDEGPEILGRLEQAAATSPAVAWALKFLGTNSGLDVGNPRTQTMLDQLAVGGVLTEAQAESLKGLALRPLVITQAQVAEEMYEPDGTEK
jgi:hypothetical protein